VFTPTDGSTDGKSDPPLLGGRTARKGRDRNGYKEPDV
jgi:hypothetical protein